MSKNLISNTRNLVFLLLGFTFPLSVALSNILVVLLAILILVEGSFSEKIQKINSSKWMKSVLILWVMYIIYYFLFGRYTDTFWLIKRISLLLLLPIFYTSNFSEKTIYKSVFAFLISMFLSSATAIGRYYEIINLNNNSFKLAAFLEYTDHNVFLAVALIISYYFLFRELQQKLSKFLYIICFFFPFLLLFFLPNVKDRIYRYIVLTFITFYSFSLFTEGGRMGQLTFLILFGLLTIFLLKNYPILRFVIPASYLLIVSLFVYQTSIVVQNRFHPERVIKKMIDGDSDRSVLLEETITLIKKNPILGYGTGSFTDKFGSVNETTKKIVENDKHNTPHNNYLYVWFEIGILGIMVFLSVFYFQIKELIKKADGAFIILFPIMFLIIMLSDSYLYAPRTLILYLFLSIITINYQCKPS